MKALSASTWQRSMCGAAGVVVLGLMLGIMPRTGGGQAVCVGDCSGDEEVTVDELLTMVNIALGNASVSECDAGDANNDEAITVDEILTAVNNALSGCAPVVTPTPTPGAAACGNGVVDEGEDCDNGGVCTGGNNAGDACTADAQCQGNGICLAGLRVGSGCVADGDCPGSRCIKCKTFGGSGCAANCTSETDVPYVLKPGQVSGIDIVAGTSGAVVNGDILTIPLPLTGSQVLTIGKERNGQIPAVIKAGSLILPRIPVSTLACACVRGAAIRTCGGTLFQADGVTLSRHCTAGFTGETDCAAEGLPPCAFLHGEGNSASGTIGCNGIEGVNLNYEQDCNGEPGEPPLEPVIALSGAGGPGSAVILSTLAIGTVVGACTGTGEAYGPDGMFCTDDDPQANRGTPQTLPAVTGRATGLIFNVNDFPGADNGPFSVTGAAFSCSDLASGRLTGASLAGAFTACDQATTGDIVVTNAFVGQ